MASEAEQIALVARILEDAFDAAPLRAEGVAEDIVALLSEAEPRERHIDT